MPFDYEAEREANIKRNNELLLSLGLDLNVFTGAPTTTTLAPAQSKPKPKKPTPAQKKVVDEADYNEDKDEEKADKSSDDDEPKPKKVKPARASLGARRSARNERKPAIDYASEEGMKRAGAMPTLVSKAAKKRKRAAAGTEVEWENPDDDEDDGNERPRDRLGKRTRNPKTYGHIHGVPVGKTWELRMHCSTDAVHAPPVSGISGNKHTGAYSIALSGGYEDDVDLGYAFTFTGAGGRDLRGTKDKPKNLRTAPQSCDQDWDTNPLNAALKTSSETKKPVRVIRGYKLHSKFAPASGYRYDGLYVVERAWMDVGLNKGHFKVCKYALTRLPDRPPLPERDLEAEAQSSDEEEPTSAGDDETQETGASSGDEAMDAKDED